MKILFFLLGFFSLLSQTLILREFIISFGGSELGIGLFYFFWLFWVGAGAFLVLTPLGKSLSRHFLKLLLIYPVLSFLELIFFLTMRGMAKVSWWEFFTLEKVSVYLFLFTALLSFFTGIIFTLGTLWFRKLGEKNSSLIISSAYIWEAMGSFISGCLITILIIKLLPPSLILLWASVGFIIISFSISIRFRERVSIIGNSILLAICIFFIFNPSKSTEFFHNLRMRHLLPHGDFMEEVYTPYQHLLIGKLPNQQVILSNGAILSSIPEVIDAERESALFISQAKFPRNILIFGYGVENLIKSFLKFPVERITYVIEDRIYYQTVYRNLPPKFKREIDDRRLRIAIQSPRIFLKDIKEGEKFDLVVIYTPDPSNLVINTFFTREFYLLIKNNLKREGVLATKITSAENYIGEAIRNYGASLYYTLKEVFPKIVIVPGKINWFFAGKRYSPITDDPVVLEKRLRDFIPDNFSFFPQGFRSIFLKERVAFVRDTYINNSLFKNVRIINSDSHPLAFFLNLVVTARYSNSYLVKFFKKILLAGPYIFFVPLLILFSARIYFLLRIENIRQNRIVFNCKLFQFFSGFLGFSFHLTLIFLFQNKFGTIFQLIGLINSIFMLGLSLGGILGKYFIKRFSSLKAIMWIIIGESILIIISYPIFNLMQIPYGAAFVSFLLFFMCSGILTGASYPLCASVLKDNKLSLANISGHLELLDHWGGALSGLLTGILMLPLLGVLNTIFILSFICVLLVSLFAAEIFSFKILVKEITPRYLAFPYIRTSFVLSAIGLSLLVNSFLLERGKNWEEKPPKLLEMTKGCERQTQPFPAYVGEENGEKFYFLESREFAPRIRGFAGPIDLLIKTDAREKIIKDVSVIHHRETPSYVRGMGKFLSQFKGKPLNSTFSLNGIDAISGATITSQAIIDIINEVSQRVEKSQGKEHLKKLGGEQNVVDITSWVLISFTLTAILLSFLPHSPLLRKAYLILVVIVLGGVFNISFSFFHLGNLLTLNLPVPTVLSQFLIYLIPLGLGILFGQFWCGWLCPFGALQEIIALPSSVKISSYLDRKARYFKYIFLAIFILILSWRRDAYLFAQEPLSIFFLNPLQISMEKILSISIVFFSLFFLRFWCRYFCICGAFLSFFNKLSIFKRLFTRRYTNCLLGIKNVYDIDCLQCSVCNKRK